MLRAIGLLILAGCAPCKPIVIQKPVEVIRPVMVVQPVPADLLRQHDIAEGKPSECLDVARARKTELEQCNADKRAISGLGRGSEPEPGRGD